MDSNAMPHNEEVPLTFDGDNSYPECEGCGHCCELNVICMTEREFETVCAYVEEHRITPADQNRERCCFQRPDRSCMIWSARPQICRLHHCHVPRTEILRRNPAIVVPEDLWLVDMHEVFVNGNITIEENAS